MTTIEEQTLQIAYTNLADPNLCKTDNWIAGAKWQAERMYSEEDVLEILFELSCNSYTDKEEMEEWFEKFKKK
jgi:hypothetical protein